MYYPLGVGLGRLSVQKVFSKDRLSRLRTNQGNMSEFATCLLVFFLFALFPMINLIMFAAASGTAMLITRNAVAAAATSGNYGLALNAMQKSVTNDLSGGFAKFAKITANGGYSSCGADLYIVSTTTGASGTTTVSTKDTALTSAPDASGNTIYEYRVATSFTIQPFVNLASVPFIANVPAIGASVPFNGNAERVVEEPTGLNVSTAP